MITGTSFPESIGMVIISKGIKSPATAEKLKKVSDGISVICCIFFDVIAKPNSPSLLTAEKDL